MSLRLRELIRSVRACKTAAAEREVIKRESALIRTALKEEDNPYKARNVAKLIYIHMLGYPSQFGQVECVNLIGSKKFPEKKVGYLALTILLDENQEVLTLVQNYLQKDLNDENFYIQALALSVLGNISSEDMIRDLTSDMERLLTSSTNPYIRKKVCLCCTRAMRKCPDLVDQFKTLIVELFSEKNHGVLVGATRMALEAVTQDPSSIPFFRRYIPHLVRIMKNLLLSAYAVEHDICGVSDPFLQVQILHLLRILGTGHRKASDAMSEILAQVATNTDHQKTAGNSVLYECVYTMMSIESESGLKVLAVNTIGRFLMSRDQNVKYVALRSLSKVIDKDLKALQRYRNFIVDCLKDPDISIRRRSLDILCLLVNQQNVTTLVPDLIQFLMVSDLEFKEDLTARICQVVEKFSPNTMWRVETTISVLSLAGQFVHQDVVRNFVALVMNSPDQRQEIVRKLYVAFLEHSQQETLVQVASWCIGEFGDDLTEGASEISEEFVVDMLTNIIRSQSFSAVTKHYVITALVKLAVRFPTCEEQIRDAISSQSHSYNLELQTRSCEYSVLLRHEEDKLGVLAPLPAVDIESVLTHHVERLQEREGAGGVSAAEAAADRSSRSRGAILLGELEQEHTKRRSGSSGSGSGSGSSSRSAEKPAPGAANLLDDIFGFGPSTSSSSSSQQQQHPTSGPGASSSSSTSASGNGGVAKKPATSLMDELFDIPSGNGSSAAGASGFGFSPTPATSAQPLPGGGGAFVGMGAPLQPQAPMGNGGGFMMMGGGGMLPGHMPPQAPPGFLPSSAPQATPPPPPSFSSEKGVAPRLEQLPPMVVVDSDAVVVEFTYSKDSKDERVTTIHARYTNKTEDVLEDFKFQVSVLKHLALEIKPPSSKALPSNGSVTQDIIITNSLFGEKHPALRVRMAFKRNGQAITTDPSTINNLPAGM